MKAMKASKAERLKAAVGELDRAVVEEDKAYEALVLGRLNYKKAVCREEAAARKVRAIEDEK